MTITHETPAPRTRLYLVSKNETPQTKGGLTLVEATSHAAALKIVTRGIYTVSLPDTLEVVRLMNYGVNAISAKNQYPGQPPQPLTLEN